MDKERDKVMNRRGCLDKLKSIAYDLEILHNAFNDPSNDIVKMYCETYEDLVQDLANVLETLRVDYGEETITEFNLGLFNE